MGTHNLRGPPLCKICMVDNIHLILQSTSIHVKNMIFAKTTHGSPSKSSTRWASNTMSQFIFGFKLYRKFHQVRFATVHSQISKNLYKMFTKQISNLHLCSKFKTSHVKVCAKKKVKYEFLLLSNKRGPKGQCINSFKCLQWQSRISCTSVCVCNKFKMFEK